MIVVALALFLGDVMFQVYGQPETTNWEIVAHANHSLAMALIFFEAWKKMKHDYPAGKWFMSFMGVFYLFDLFNEFRFWGYDYVAYKESAFYGSDTIAMAMIVMVSALVFFGMDIIHTKNKVKL